MAYYALTLCLDINMPTCITARNKAAEARFGGYQVVHSALGLPEDQVGQLDALRAEYGAHFDFNEDRYPTVEQERAFLIRLQALVPQFVATLGSDFSIEVE